MLQRPLLRLSSRRFHPGTAGADGYRSNMIWAMSLTVDGMALLPLVTALIVGARLTGTVRGEPRPRGGHVIAKARGVAFARHLDMPVVIGDAPGERTLRRAGPDGAIALVCATSSDIVNLETALQARAMRGEDLRIVLRLFDDDLAQRVSETLGNVVSRSVSYLAAGDRVIVLATRAGLSTFLPGNRPTVTSPAPQQHIYFDK
jgi:voltage-gated potassium channel Kch